MPAFVRTSAGLVAAGLSVAGLLPVAAAAASPLTSAQHLAARSTASSWLVDPLSSTARAKLMAVPAVPSRYDGHALRWTRALWTAHNGHLAVPADRAIGHQLSKGQAVTLAAPFAYGKVTLPRALRAEVTLLKDSLTEASSLRCEGYSGYTTGRPATTSRLSRQRAAAVCHALAARPVTARTVHHRTPVAAVTTTSVGYGGSRPVVVGGKRSHALTSRAANRRVVVVITGQSASSTGTTTAPAVPSAPTITQVQAADHSVTLDFTAPATTGSSAVTGYEYSSDGWSWHPLTYSGSGPLTATLSGLAHSTTYLMAVRGVNALGSGASSNEVLVTTAPSPAAAPSLSRVFASGFGPDIYVIWPVPLDDGGSSITGYQYQLDGGDWTDVVTVNSPVSGMASISQGVSTPLTCGAPASVALRAVTAVGPGFASAPMTTTVDCSEM